MIIQYNFLIFFIGSIPLNSSGSDSDLKNASGSKSESIMDELVGVFSSEVIIEKPTTNKPIMPKPISPLVRDHLNLQSHGKTNL